jgi:purine-binding chemotaxis protein CheW
MSDSGSAVVVRLGPAEFGIPVDQAEEVLRTPPITRLPFPPPAVCGVASVRGSLFPVLDLGVRLLGREARRPGRTLIVTDPDGEHSVGLLVDAVTGLVQMPETVQEPPPEAEATLPPGWVAGMVSRAPGRLVTLLHLGPVLAVAAPADQERR